MRKKMFGCAVGIGAALVTALLSGCQPAAQTNTAAPAQQPALSVGTAGGPTGGPAAGPTGGNAGPQSDQTTSPDQMLGDPAEMRLGDIGEALMMYYSVNKQMPAQLTDVQTATSEQLNFISPNSGSEYGYAPGGLVAGNGVKRIYVYDSGPGKDGKRWCLEGIPPAAGAALWMETVDMPEATFKLYSAGGQ
jgi:Spy/CpxP family protein refolding chaperone